MMSLFLLQLNCATYYPPPASPPASRNRNGNGTASPVGSGDVSGTASPALSRSPSVAAGPSGGASPLRSGSLDASLHPVLVDSQPTTPRAVANQLLGFSQDVKPPEHFFEPYKETIAKLRVEVEALAQQHTELNAALTKAAADKQQALSKKESEVADHKKRLTQAQAELSAKESALEARLKESVQVAAQLLAAQAENGKKESQLKQQRSQIDTLEAKISELEEQSRKQVEELTAMREQLEKALALQEGRSQGQKSSEVFAVPSLDFTKLPEALKRAEQVAELMEKNAHLQATLAIKTQENISLNDSRISSQAELAIVNERVAALQVENGELRGREISSVSGREEVDGLQEARFRDLQKLLAAKDDGLKKIREELAAMTANRDLWLKEVGKFQRLVQPPLKENARGCC